MPAVRYAKRFVQVPDTWEGWVMRVLTVAVVITLFSSWYLLVQVHALQETADKAASSRTAFQDQQTVRMCALLHEEGVDPKSYADAPC